MTQSGRIEFPHASVGLEAFGLKSRDGGAHISRTMMLAELEAVLAAVPTHGTAADYRDAVLNQNALGKTTASTRDKSLRHLRELYALDPAVPLFSALRRLAVQDPASLPMIALLVAWSRDPLLRATWPPVGNAHEGQRVESSALAAALQHAFGDQYSELNRNKIGRNAASSWTQSGHLAGRTKKVRQRIKPTPVAVTLALFLGQVAGFHGASVFQNPWCLLLDLDADRARSLAQSAHRAGFLNLRAVGDGIELTFPSLADLQHHVS
jgi:hypothetical protein